jgi:hypothetical protein
MRVISVGNVKMSFRRFDANDARFFVQSVITWAKFRGAAVEIDAPSAEPILLA